MPRPRPLRLAAVSVAALLGAAGVACAQPGPGLLTAGAVFERGLPSATPRAGDACVVRVEAAATGSPLALPLATLAAADPAAAPDGAAGGLPPTAFSPERARVLLQSLTIPGWGQATLGRHTAAKVFGAIEIGIWTAFAAFRIQEELRMQSAVETARLFAGIDLEGRDESYRRLVGDYPSSDDYNVYVVYRDAANQAYDDPAAFNAWVDQYSLTGDDAWAWVSQQSYDDYRDEIKDSQRAGMRANTCLALAIANRLVSALHAARFAGAMPPASTGVRLVPSFGVDRAALALRARF